jgi:hypothetical protein
MGPENLNYEGLLDPNSVQPTRREPLSTESIRKLEPLFQQGLESTLDPVLIFTDGNQRLLFDGNHRCALANQYGKKIPYRIIKPGDTITDTGSDLTINQNDLRTTRTFRDRNLQDGITDFPTLRSLR